MNSCQLNKQLQQILPVYKGVFVCFVSVGMKVRKHVKLGCRYWGRRGSGVEALGERSIISSYVFVSRVAVDNISLSCAPGA